MWYIYAPWAGTEHTLLQCHVFTQHTKHCFMQKGKSLHLNWFRSVVLSYLNSAVYVKSFSEFCGGSHSKTSPMSCDTTLTLSGGGTWPERNDGSTNKTQRAKYQEYTIHTTKQSNWQEMTVCVPLQQIYYKLQTKKRKKQQ